jgi:hypothetical protein
MKPVGKPDAGNPHVRFDERGGETGRESDTAPFLDSTTALAARASVPASIDSSPLPRDTKQAQVLAMLTRDQGASGPQIAEAMGWAPHTVRGFLASLAKKGIKVDVLERVRQVGPKRTGVKGSYTVYHVTNGSRQ